jgi:hypothetical protein
MIYQRIIGSTDQFLMQWGYILNVLCKGMGFRIFLGMLNSGNSTF